MNDIVITHQEPKRHKEHNNQKDNTKSETNTCHTLLKDLLTPRHCHYPTGCSFIKVQRQCEKMVRKTDFELKVLQRVRFWLEKKYNALDFELKFLRHFKFEKVFAFEKKTFWFILLRENGILGNFRVFKKA